MATIARRIERDYPQRPIDTHLPSTIPNAISGAVSSIARQLNAAAILPLTKSGATAHNVSKFRPSTPILAITSEVNVARKLQLVWGVTPLLIETQKSTTATFTLAMAYAQEIGVVKDGDLCVQTAGTLAGISGSTDLIKVGIVSAVLGRGTGFGSGSVSGKVRIAMSASDCARLEPGDILVARDTSADYLDGIRDAAAVITEQAGEDSHAAVIAKRLGVPVITGVANATRDLREGEVVTLHVKDGVVHRGTGSNLAMKLDTML
jgi:pyruvate kinase